MRRVLIAFILVTVAIAVAYVATRPVDAPDIIPGNGKTKVDEPTEPDTPPTTPEPLKPTVDPGFRFTTIKDSGVDFVHRSGITADRHYPCANGSGLATLDFDLDGNIDLYFGTGQYFLEPDDVKPNRLYRSLGDWKFADCSRESVTELNIFTAGLAVADFNEDGFPDLYVTSAGRNQLLQNCGDGTFQPIEDSGADDPGFAASAAFLDYDNDGPLDIYLCNYGLWSIETNIVGSTGPPHNKPTYAVPQQIESAPDVLLRNQGDGTFLDVTSDHPIAQLPGRAQGVIALNLNDDDLIDVYVGNDMNTNWLLMNDGQSGFEDVSQTAGTGYNRAGQTEAGMGVASADVNRDGRFDLLVTNFEREYNSLYLNKGDGFFEDSAHQMGVVTDAMQWVGWGVTLNDLNLDGWPDLVVTNGHVDPDLSEYSNNSPYEQPAAFWLGGEAGFEFTGNRSGEYFQTTHPGRALSIADLDNDGDFDIVVGHQDQAPALLRSDLNSGQKSIELRLVGRRGNRDCVGSRVSVRTVEPPLVFQVTGGGSYLSANDNRILIPANDATDIDIVWPGGRRSTATGLVPGKRYLAIEPTRGRSALVSELP